MEVRGDRVEPARPPDEAVVLRVHFRFDKEHLDATVEEECAEHVENPFHDGDERHADPDHQAAHDQGAENAPVEHAMLVFARNTEVGEDQSDDKNVVHRERQLDEVAGDELEGFRFTPHESQGQRKKHGQGKPDGGPGQGFLELDRVGVAMKQAKIQCEKDQHAADEADPVPGGDLDQGEHGIKSGEGRAEKEDRRAAGLDLRGGGDGDRRIRKLLRGGRRSADILVGVFPGWPFAASAKGRHEYRRSPCQLAHAPDADYAPTRSWNGIGSPPLVHSCAFGGYLRRAAAAPFSTPTCADAPRLGRWPLCHHSTSALAM